MAKKLYVGNLPYSMTDDGLRDLFSESGTVETATIINDKFSGRSKGFGFVEMASDGEAQAAIDTLNGREVEGRAIVVNEARPMTERKPGGFGGGGGGSRGGSRGGFGRGGYGGGHDR